MTPTSTFLLLISVTMINTIAAQIPNWDIRFSSLETNFDASVKDEIIMQYQIGRDRSYTVQLFAKDCLGAIEGTTAIATTTRTSSATTSSSLDYLKVMIDLDKTFGWIAVYNCVSFCNYYRATKSLKRIGARSISPLTYPLTLSWRMSPRRAHLYHRALVPLMSASISRPASAMDLDLYAIPTNSLPTH